MVAEKLQTLINTKAAIKAALVSRGVDVPDDIPFSQYANLIANMNTVTELSTSNVVINPKYGDNYLCTGATSITINTPDSPNDLQKPSPVTIRWNCTSAPSITLNGSAFLWANGVMPEFGECGEISIGYAGSKHLVVGVNFSGLDV